MVMSADGAWIFLARPVAATLLGLSAILLIFVALKGRSANNKGATP
jgi:hypothetical protein